MNEQDPQTSAPTPAEQDVVLSPLERLSDWLLNEGAEHQRVISGVRQFTDQASQILPESSAVGLSVSKGKYGSLHLWVHVPIEELRFGEDLNDAEKVALETAKKISGSFHQTARPAINSNIRVTPHLTYYSMDRDASSVDALNGLMEEIAKAKQPEDDEVQSLTKPSKGHTPIGIITLS